MQVMSSLSLLVARRTAHSLTRACDDDNTHTHVHIEACLQLLQVYHQRVCTMVHVQQLQTHVVYIDS